MCGAEPRLLRKIQLMVRDRAKQTAAMTSLYDKNKDFSSLQFMF